MLLSHNVGTLVTDPSVILQFVAADHVMNIAHREFVIGIRNHRPENVSLAGRQTNIVKFAVYAKQNSEISDNWVRVIGATPSANWVREHTRTENCIEVTNPRNALDIAVTGNAKVVLPTFIGSTTPGLTQISTEIEELQHKQWLVTHHEDRHLPEVRAVIDRLVEILQRSTT